VQRRTAAGVPEITAKGPWSNTASEMTVMDTEIDKIEELEQAHFDALTVAVKAQARALETSAELIAAYRAARHAA
jgi:hypothetical protein